MPNNKNNDDSDLFQQAMASLGVNKSTAIESNSLKLRKKQAPHAKTQKQTSKQDSDWITISYKDMVPEEPGSNHQLSAPLKAKSTQLYPGGLSRKNIKRLQRGQYPIQFSIDLHGLNVDQAIDVLNTQINQLTLNKQVCLLIIHGKGYHSQNGVPKLKSLTERWLKAHPRTLAYCSAQPKDGGTGAVYVLLKH